jgi:GNAT superfamily N-acetyltransferase
VNDTAVDDLNIRFATEEDSALVLELIVALAEYERLAHEVTATEEDIRKSLFGERPAAEVLLAYRGGTCAGFALFFRTYSTFLGKPGLYLEDLYVRPEWRGRGIGLALLVALSGIARERNYGRVEWSVLNWNEPSIAFYRKLGAEPLDDWTRYRLTGAALRRLSELQPWPGPVDGPARA